MRNVAFLSFSLATSTEVEPRIEGRIGGRDSIDDMLSRRFCEPWTCALRNPLASDAYEEADLSSKKPS